MNNSMWPDSEAGFYLLLALLMGAGMLAATITAWWLTYQAERLERRVRSLRRLYRREKRNVARLLGDPVDRHYATTPAGQDAETITLPRTAAHHALPARPLNGWDGGT